MIELAFEVKVFAVRFEATVDEREGQLDHFSRQHADDAGRSNQRDGTLRVLLPFALALLAFLRLLLLFLLVSRLLNEQFNLLRKSLINCSRLETLG